MTDTSTSERRWFPAPAFFIAADFDDAPVVDRSAVPLTTVLARLQAELHGGNRELEREFRRSFPREGRINELRDEMRRVRGEREMLLDSLMWHQQTWAHLADDCRICDRSVSWA